MEPLYDVSVGPRGQDIKHLPETFGARMKDGRLTADGRVYAHRGLSGQILHDFGMSLGCREHEWLAADRVHFDIPSFRKQLHGLEESASRGV
jgi:hypothetical protein